MLNVVDFISGIVQLLIGIGNFLLAVSNFLFAVGDFLPAFGKFRSRVFKLLPAVRYFFLAGLYFLATIFKFFPCGLKLAVCLGLCLGIPGKVLFVVRRSRCGIYLSLEGIKLCVGVGFFTVILGNSILIFCFCLHEVFFGVVKLLFVVLYFLFGVGQLFLIVSQLLFTVGEV